MERFFFDKFYLFFQGVLVFQAFFLFMLFAITKRRDIFFYSLFLCTTAFYFFINAPNTFFNLDDQTIFSSRIYVYSNTPLTILAGLFYILFLRAFFLGLYMNRKLDALYRLLILADLCLILASFIFVYLNRSNQGIFYLLNFLTTGVSIYIILAIWRKKIPGTHWVGAGIFFNIIGTSTTVIMIILERQNVRNILTVDYPLFFMRCGILADMFFYQVAILKKWHIQEKQLMVQTIEKELAVEKVRSQISSQLHDDIGSTLSGVSMYTHMASDLLDKNEQAKAKKSLLIIQKSADDIVERLGDLVWSVKPKTGGLYLFFERLQEYAMQMCLARNIRLTLSIPAEIKGRLIPPEQLHHLYLVIKEAINNAVKYSNATLLEVSVKEEDGLLTFSVIDNGSGFDQLLVRHGNGLENMQKRANEIGARLSIQSKKGEGALIAMQLKIT
jgi:signal transduction histidine kinase